MSNRFLASIAVILSFLVIGACSGVAPAVSGETVRIAVGGGLVVVAVVLLYIAITRKGLTTIWVILPAASETIERVLLGLLGVVLLAAGLYIIVPSASPATPTQEAARRDSSTEEMEETPSTEPGSPGIGPTLTVIDLDDGRRHVRSDIYIIDRRGVPTSLGETAGDGDFMILPEHQCLAGSMIQVRPHQEYGPTTWACPVDDDLRINVMRVSNLENLRANAAALESRGMYHVAALVYSELAARSSGSEADAAEAKTYEMVALAEALRYGGTERAVNDEGEISDSLFEAIRSFQTRNGLNDSGALDYATLERLALDPIEPYITGRPAIPAGEPE